MPDNPNPDVHTFIIGFVCNKQFSRSSSKKRVTLYVKGNINEKVLFKEDISTQDAIKKYGDLIIVSIV